MMSRLSTMTREETSSCSRSRGMVCRRSPWATATRLVVGDEVFAIGTPRGLAQTLSSGLVSAIRDFGEGYRHIQTTSPISPGSSGGGLFDDHGRLVGITRSLRH